MRKNAYVPDLIQGVHDQINHADKLPASDVRIGAIITAVKQLTDLTERLYQRIADLEKVQNERGGE